MQDDERRRAKETLEPILLLAASACFLLAHFEIAPPTVFWMGLVFNLMVAFDAAVRK